MNAAQFSEFAENFPRPDMRLVNDRSVEVARSHMESLCGETIDIVYDGIAAALEKDRELFDEIKAEAFPNGAIIGRHVKQDTVVTAPTTSGVFTRTFFTHIEPEPEAMTRRERAAVGNMKQYIDVHVPVGELTIGQFKMPPTDEVQEIYVEVGSDDFVQWFGISRTGLIYEYEPPQHTSSQETPDDALWQDFNNRVPDGIKIITDIFQRVSNWRTMPQDIEIISR